MSATRRTAIVLLASTGLASAALLAYEVVLLLRFSSGGAHNVGGDVIVFAYTLAVASLFGALLSFLNIARADLGVLRPAVICLALIATLLWLALHLGGEVFSHESMFVNKSGDPGPV